MESRAALGSTESELNSQLEVYIYILSAGGYIHTYVQGEGGGDLDNIHKHSFLQESPRTAR